MQENNFSIENNILHFVYEDSDMLIDCEQLETMKLYENFVAFMEDGKFKTFPYHCFIIKELICELLENHNFMICGRKNIVNLNLIKSISIERDKDRIIETYEDGLGISDNHNVVITFLNGRREYIKTNTWREAERLYHDIDDKLTDLRNAQVTCN